MFQSNVNIVIQIRKAARLQILLHDHKMDLQWFFNEKETARKTKIVMKEYKIDKTQHNT